MITPTFVEFVINDLFAGLNVTGTYNFGAWTLSQNKKTFGLIDKDVFYWKAGSNNIEQLQKQGKIFEYDKKDGSRGRLNYYSCDIESITLEERKIMMKESLKAKNYPIKKKK